MMTLRPMLSMVSINVASESFLLLLSWNQNKERSSLRSVDGRWSCLSSVVLIVCMWLALSVLLCFLFFRPGLTFFAKSARDQGATVTEQCRVFVGVTGAVAG
jgi:hypothetical protein